jgi:glucan-binding YG repeat protein
MKKQTKVVAVLAAAAVLAMGATAVSFADGWTKDDAGVWHYEEDGDYVTDEWRKDGGKYFYLDEDGDMLTNGWVDDEYYVGADGAMLVNQWVKTFADDADDNDPDEDGERWYYFGAKGKKVVDNNSKKINGKTYAFDGDGKMLYGWQEIDGNGYFFGEEDDGARTESRWLWLEKSGLLDDDEEDQSVVLGCSEDDDCDDEGWYWFQSSGKLYKDAKKKKIKGKYFMFNEHGQMLYEWIDGVAVSRTSNAELDNDEVKASIAQILYYDVNGEDASDGSRVTGWRYIDGSKATGASDDTNWYYFDKGEADHANDSSDYVTADEDGAAQYRARIKEQGKYWCFDHKGKMKTGLQYIPAKGKFFFYDDNGYEKTGKVASVECDDDDYAFYFNTKTGHNAEGVTGEKDGYLYFHGKKLMADDDYKFFYVEGDIYLVNTKGKIVKKADNKKYDIDELGEDIHVSTKNYKVTAVEGLDLEDMKADLPFGDAASLEKEAVCQLPYIALYDDYYTYVSDGVQGWLGINE